MLHVSSTPHPGIGFSTFATGEAGKPLTASTPHVHALQAKLRHAIKDTLPRGCRLLTAAELKYGEQSYERARDLPGLMHLFPAEIARLEQQAPDAVLRALVRATRAERRRGRQGHWRYSLQRHIGLMQALAAERLRCEAGACE